MVSFVLRLSLVARCADRWGVLWFLPNHEVANPFCLRIVPTVAVMMSTTFGTRLGDVTVGCQYGFEDQSASAAPICRFRASYGA
jgi:hypothetical protein